MRLIERFLGRGESVAQFPHKPEAISDVIRALTKLYDPSSGAKSDKPWAPNVLKQHGNSVFGDAEVTGRIDSLRIPKLDIQDTKSSDCMVSLSPDGAGAGTIVEAAATPLPFGNSLHRAVRWLRAAFCEKAPQSNQLLLHEKRCSIVCANAEVSFCCEVSQFCTTSKGIPVCTPSTSLESQAFPSTTSTSTDSSQTMPLFSATVSSTFTTTMVTTHQSSSTASNTQTSTTTSSVFLSAASNTQTSTATSSLSSSSILSSSITSSSSSSSSSSIPSTPTPTPGSGSHHFDANLFVAIIVPIIIAVITITTAVYVKRTRRLMNGYIFCCLECDDEGEDHQHECEGHQMRNLPNSRM